VYFAEHSSKSNNYVFGCGNPCAGHGELNCFLCVRRLLICKVALGKVFEAQELVKSPPSGYHSVKAIPQSGLIYPEYVIYNDAQVS
jgi:tankyrase